MARQQLAARRCAAQRRCYAPAKACGPLGPAASGVSKVDYVVDERAKLAPELIGCRTGLTGCPESAAEAAAVAAAAAAAAALKPFDVCTRHGPARVRTAAHALGMALQLLADESNGTTMRFQRALHEDQVALDARASVGLCVLRSGEKAVLV
jgi:hypothetical protein